MARTLNDIQQSIIDAKNDSVELTALEVLTTDEKASLTSLTSSSKVAVWRLFIYIIAVCIYVLELLFDAFRSEIEAKVNANRPHTEDWYKSKALAFQYGDTLVDSDEYAIVDVEKQIVKQVAIVEGDRKLIIKVATLDGSILQKLQDIDQINAFASYMHKVKDAGTLLEIINEDADQLKVELDFYYDALIVDDEGLIIANPTVSVVEMALNTYLKSLDFNGVFDVNTMTDFLQKATGYKSLEITYVGFKAGIAVSYIPINRTYKPLAGYMTLAELSVNYYASI